MLIRRVGKTGVTVAGVSVAGVTFALVKWGVTVTGVSVVGGKCHSTAEGGGGSRGHPPLHLKGFHF